MPSSTWNVLTMAPKMFAQISPSRLAIPLAFAALVCAAPAMAQAPSMLGAPGLSPVAPEAPSTTVAAPPQLSAPPDQGAPAASSCDTDMQKLAERRNGAIQQINSLVNGSKNKKLDPAAACPKFRNLASVENAMKAWMLKNKDWCSIPDQTIEDMKKGFARTPVIAGQACNAAAQMSKMRQMQAQQQRQQQAGGGGGAPAGVKLPTGPL